jgi:hypothetical protein
MPPSSRRCRSGLWTPAGLSSLRRFLLLAVALLGLAGCGTAPAVLAPAPQPVTVATSATTSVDNPAHLSFPAVGVDADLTPTGLNPDGTVKVPPLDRAAEVQFLNWAPSIAAGRPIVLLSHVNGRNAAGEVIPGGFGKLASAKPGDKVTVASAAGASAVYAVTSNTAYSKASFPSSVYRVRAQPTLLLITCGGVIDHTRHSYLSNIVVEAVTS